MIHSIKHLIEPKKWQEWQNSTLDLEIKDRFYEAMVFEL